MEVILTSQSLTCRYQEAFQTKQEQETEAIQQQQPHIVSSNQEWQIILKVAAHKNRRSKRSGYAYEAKTLDGNELFSGGASYGRKNQQLAIQDAVGEAILKAMQMGIQQNFNTQQQQQQACATLQPRKRSNLDRAEFCCRLESFPTIGFDHSLLVCAEGHYLTCNIIATVATGFPVSHCRRNTDHV